MSTVVIVPMLGRPHRVKPILESIRATSDVHVVFALTKGDDEVIDEVEKESVAYRLFNPKPYGDYAHKINTVAANTCEDYIFTGADDLLFHHGWLTEAERLIENEGIGVVGTNDMSNPAVMAGQHATHSLVSREYLERGLADGKPGIYCEDYWHEFVDNELVDTAKHRNAWAFAFNSRVEHLHPFYGKGQDDSMYQMMWERMKSGELVYMKRRHLWT